VTDEPPGAEDDGVEEELSSDEPGGPFDPNKVRTRLWMPPIGQVLRQIEAKEIDLSPYFRGQTGWTDVAQSRLIESILIRLPLSSFYMVATDEDILKVVDGVQRLSALKRFMLDRDLKLQGLEFLVDLEGKTVEDLPRSLRRRIEETALTVHVIERGTPPEARLSLFRRINAAGSRLTAQEIRHAMHPGPAQAFLEELAATDEFQRATCGEVSRKGMQDCEFVLRFIAFLLIPPEAYAEPDPDTFLNWAMRSLNKMPSSQRDAFSRKFRRAMDAAANVLGQYAFRNPTETGRRARISKFAFEAWSVNLDRCSDRELDDLARRRDRLRRSFSELLASDDEFEKAMYRRSGHKNAVRIRFIGIRNLLRTVLDDQVD